MLAIQAIELDGEFDPGSGQTLAACLTHASRTSSLLFGGEREWRTGEEHVGDLPRGEGYRGESLDNPA